MDLKAANLFNFGEISSKRLKIKIQESNFTSLSTTDTLISAYMNAELLLHNITFNNISGSVIKARPA